MIPKKIAYISASLRMEEREYVVALDGEGPGRNGVNRYVTRRGVMGCGDLPFGAP